MLGIIFTVVLWAVFIKIYIRHKRKVREFTKLNPKVLKNSNVSYLPSNEFLDNSFSKQLEDESSSPAYDHLACNINFNSKE